MTYWYYERSPKLERKAFVRFGKDCKVMCDFFNLDGRRNGTISYSQTISVNSHWFNQEWIDFVGYENYGMLASRFYLQRDIHEPDLKKTARIRTYMTSTRIFGDLISGCLILYTQHFPKHEIYCNEGESWRGGRDFLLQVFATKALSLDTLTLKGSRNYP